MLVCVNIATVKSKLMTDHTENELSTPDIERLAEALRTNSTLKFLDISSEFPEVILLLNITEDHSALFLSL